MTEYQSDYYTAMVMAASNYADMHGTAARPLTTLPTSRAPYRSANCSSATSVSSNTSSQAYPAMRSATHPCAPTNHQLSSGSAAGYPGVCPPKRYAHNPYASVSSTPSCANLNTPPSANTSAESLPSSQVLRGGTSTPPCNVVYASTDSSCGEMGAATSTLTEQFLSVVGGIAATACSPRGRHLLVSVLRLQHLDKIEVIYAELLRQVNTVALDPQGCHVMRTLIEYISTEQMAAMVPYFEPKTIVQLATASQHTRRVLQSVFERHRCEALTRIVEVVAADCPRLAMTQQGCIGIMRIIEYAMLHQKQILTAKLIPALPLLTMDPYGNYVVQCILQNMEGCTTISVVCAAFSHHWVPLSCNKYASNVMEKVVYQMGGHSRQRLLCELVFDPTNLHCLMQDGFGNFVLQAIIDSCRDAMEFKGVQAAVVPLLHSSPYGHKIEAKLKKKQLAFFGVSDPAAPLA